MENIQAAKRLEQTLGQQIPGPYLGSKSKKA